MKRGKNKSIIFLLLFAVVTVILFNIPFGRYILYPFIILGTWFHEMSHGIAAIGLGGYFQRLELYSDGSGVAFHSGGLFMGAVGDAIVAGAGPLGPTLAGTILLFGSKNSKLSRIFLFLLGLFQVVSALIWIRSLFGVIIISIFGILAILIAIKGNEKTAILTLQFLAIQAFTSLYLSIDYLFSRGGVVAGSSFSSDTAVIAKNLFFPHWFWAVVILIISILLIFTSLKYILKSD